MIGFLGGTGPEGRGLGLRLAMASEKVVLGSRDAERGMQAAESVLKLAPGLSVAGGTNEDAARRGDIVFICLPYAAQRETLVALKRYLAGKIVVSTVVPLAFTRGAVRAIQIEEGSAAMQAQAILTESKVAAAFHTTSAGELLKPEVAVDSDVIVCAEDIEVRRLVMGLAEKIRGVRGVDGGGLQNAVYVESFTAMLISLNRTYKAHTGIRIVGI